jgi:hypothetical protein
LIRPYFARVLPDAETDRFPETRSKLLEVAIGDLMSRVLENIGWLRMVVWLG